MAWPEGVNAMADSIDNFNTNEVLKGPIYDPAANDPLRRRLRDQAVASDDPEYLKARIAYWMEQATVLKDKYEKLLKINEGMFPVGEKPGRIVMLFWDGRTWLRLPDKENGPAPGLEYRGYTKGDLMIVNKVPVQPIEETVEEFKEMIMDGIMDGNVRLPRSATDWKARYEALETKVREVEGRQYSDPLAQDLFAMVRGESKPINPPTERTRRNNVVE